MNPPLRPQECNMEVNFFRRRSVLKKTNALDLIPLRLLEHQQRDETTVDILLPRFKKAWIARTMKPFNPKTEIHIKLDAFGSACWMMIDGKKSVSEICKKLEQDFPDRLNSEEEIFDRVTKFMMILYQQRFISFQQILKPNQNAR